jgi:beta-lactamase superfamily II metal-dependent hydrolase
VWCLPTLTPTTWRVGCGAGEFHPRELWLGVNSPNPELQTLLREAKALKIPVVLHKAGDNLEMGGSEVAVLAPPRDAEAHPSRPNGESLVTKISYGATYALPEGDAEKKTEQQVAGKGRRPTSSKWSTVAARPL